METLHLNITLRTYFCEFENKSKGKEEGYLLDIGCGLKEIAEITPSGIS